MLCRSFGLLLAAGFAVGALPGATEAQEVTVNTTIWAVQDVRIAAEEAGVLRHMQIHESDRLLAGEVIAKVDDRQAQAAEKIAKLKLTAARKRAEDDIELRYADAAGKVARIDYDKDVQVNLKKPGTIPDIQIRQKELVWRKSLLQYEKAGNDQVLANMDADVYQAELEAAKLAVERRTIRAPFDGEVQTLFMHEAEGVNPGDPILRLVRLDQLYVKGLVSASEYDRNELQGCPVSVMVSLARGRQATVTGKVVFVSPQIQEGTDDYEVTAEVANEQVDGFWRVSPGLVGTMTIHLSQRPN